VVPAAHRLIDRGFLALRTYHLEDPVGWLLQVWLIGSTLLVTALLLRMLWQKRRATSSKVPTIPLRLEGMLVAVWWLVLLGACAYGFMLGMGG
jgi:hypothetical protein